MAELFESEDEEVSEVESFILDQGDLEEEPVLDTSKFLLSAEGAESPDLTSVDPETRAVLEAAGIHLGDTHEVDPESRAKLESLLEAAGLGKRIIDPDILRRLTSSVSCALDEAAAALTRMRSEQHQPHLASSTSSETSNSSKHQQPTPLDLAAVAADGSLIDACNDGDLEAVRRLLDEGRNVNEMTEEGESLLSLACSSGYFELAQLLLATRANVEDRGLKDTTPLMEASSAGHVDIVKLLLSHGADVNAQTSQGNTPLMYACAGGHEEVVKTLLEFQANVEDHNENGHTPLMESASAGHVGVAKILVAHGASINTHSNEFKESALTLACYKGHLEMVRFLLEAGADQEHKTEEMHTALMEASMDGHVEVARLLLDSGAQVNMPADSFESPLTLAACGGHVELAMLLLERGANIEEVNDEGYTPLMEAAREGHEEMVALLLSQGADINAQTEETQETALTLACCGGFLEVADFLIKAGVDIEAGANTPLMEAAQEGHLDLVKHLISCGANINSKTATGDTSLMYACENGHTDVAEILLDAGADIEHEAEGGRTPLMKASRAGHLCTVQFLVTKGANVNKVTTNNDHTPLSLACAGGHLSVVEYLLANGSDPTHRLKDNSTMLIEAAKGGHTTVVQLLIDYPNNVTRSSPSADATRSPGVTTTSDCDISVPRVPSHGVQPADTNSDHHISSSTQRKSSISANGSGKHMQKGLSRSKNINSNSSHHCKTAEFAEPYVPLQKGKICSANSSSNLNANKHLERRLSDSCASQILNSISTSASSPENLSTSNAVGVGLDALKETEKLEQCINNMMKRTEMLNPSREEQILQKQQILEELQRVERELQEKAQAQLLLTAQAQQQQQLIQNLCYQAGLSPPNSLPNVTGTNQSSPPTNTNLIDQQQMTNITPSVPSQAMWLLDMSALKQQLKGADGTLNLQLPSTTVSQPFLLQPAMVQTVSESLPICSKPAYITSTSAVPNLDISVASTASQTNMSSTSTSGTSSVSRARVKQNTKVKNAILKQQPQSPLPLPKTTSSAPTGEDVTKMNLRNTINTEQSNKHHVEQQQPQVTNQQNPQQFLLSEFAQNISATLRSGKQESLQLLQAAANNVKFDSSTLPLLLPPLFDSNTLNQVGLHQHQTQSTQTVIPSLPPLFDSNFLNQTGLQQQQQIQCHLQQQTQSTQTSIFSALTSNLETQSSVKVIANKSNKSNKLGTKGNQNTIHQPPNSGHIPSTSSPLLPSLTNQQLQVLKSQLAAAAAAAAATAAQQSNCPEVNHDPNVQLTTTTEFNLSDDTAACSLNNVNVSTSGIFGLGAPAFPVNLSLTPPISAVTTGSASSTIFSPSISFDQVTGNGNSFLLSTQQRTVPDGACDDALLGTESLAGTSSSQTLSANCFDGLNFTGSNSMTMFSNAVASLPVGIEPINFPAIPVSSILSTTLAHPQSLLATAANNLAASTLSATKSLPTIASNNVCGLISQQEYSTTASLDPVENYIGISSTNNNTLTPSTSVTVTTSATTTNGIPPVPSPPPWYPPVDLDSQTDSNHDTALTLACAGGHEELVQLLLTRGANMEHRDKKGFTPLMLSSTAGHASVCDTILTNGADIEAQSERTKDTALSLACSSGRYEVVELLLSRGANKEHRNVSDYTPLSLAASGGYVNIIKLLLNHGAEINSRTGSKLGISPLMLAAMNGHAATVKLLLDMGSDINAQIETNRNTALTLACFQGRCEVVSLLLDRKANVEHRAKTGLTPLMEAASGGYVEVGRILLDKGADVNAPPVPSSRDTALTIASDKGHYRFVELLLQRGAQVEVKNKKGSSPLWLACNGGHLDVVQLLVNSGADIDSQDNRKVSCLMAAFRKGHVKVVKWMVKHVTQFPSDQEMTRYLALVNDKELMKKCHQCMEIIRQAKDKQAAEANKNATILLEEIDMERSREENRKAAAARRRERKRLKKKEKQEQLKAAKAVHGGKHDKKLSHQQGVHLKQENYQDEDSESEADDEADDSNDEDILIYESPIEIQEIISPSKEPKKQQIPVQSLHIQPQITSLVANSLQQQLQTNKKKDIESKNKKNQHVQASICSKEQVKTGTNKKKEENNLTDTPTKIKTKYEVETDNFPTVSTPQTNIKLNLVNSYTSTNHSISKQSTDLASNHNIKMKNDDYEMFNELSLEISKDVNGNEKSHRSPNLQPNTNKHGTQIISNVSAANNQPQVAKKVLKREDGWKEVVRRSKKVSVPGNAISRVIGKAGCNINTVREVSGAHIEVEKQKGQGDRQIIIKGSADATRHAQQLINCLVNEPDKDLSQIIASLGLSRPNSCNSEDSITSKISGKVNLSNAKGANAQTSNSGIVIKSASMTAVFGSSSGSVTSSTVAPFASRASGVVSVRPTAALTNLAPPFATNNPVSNITSWGVFASKNSIPPRLVSTSNTSQSQPPVATSTSTKTTVSYTLATPVKGKNTRTTSSNTNTSVKIITSEAKGAPFSSNVRPSSQPFNPRVSSQQTNKSQIVKQPFSNINNTNVATTTGSGSSAPEYTPFNNLFSKVAQASVWGQSKEASKPNFASVAASGITSIATQQSTGSVTSSLTLPIPPATDQDFSVDASKAPGYRGNMHISPSNASLSSIPSSTGQAFGPIGTGPRSAPCTPPLVLHGQSNMMRQSTPPLRSSPTLASVSTHQHHQSRTVNEPLLSMVDLQTSATSNTFCSNSSLTSSYQATSLSSSYISSVSSHSNKSSYFNLAPGSSLPRSYSTNTTYSQHGPLSSVGQIHPPPIATSSLESVSTNTNSMVSSNGSNGGSVQSSLNPNAPDFSSRSSNQAYQHQNGPVSRSSAHLQSHHQAQHHRAPLPFQDVIPNPQLQMQMRAAILAAGASLQMQTLQAQAAQAAQAVQNQQARFQFSSNSSNAINHHQQQQATAAALGAPDFNPPSAETLRLLHTAISAFPAANALHASTPQNMQQFGLMQTAINMRQHQQQNQRAPTSNIQNLVKESTESVDVLEERKLPRPIGTERAQKKNPVFTSAPSTGSGDLISTNLWPFNNDINPDGSDWMQHQNLHPTSTMSAEINILHANYTNPSRNLLSNDVNLSNEMDLGYQNNPGASSGLVNYASNSTGFGPVNGLPPQMLSSQLYHNLASNSNVNTSSMNVAPSQEAADYWTGKIPSVPGLGNGVSAQNLDKLNWHSWNQHQA